MTKLRPTDDEEAYLCDKILADVEDVRNASIKAIARFGATEEAQRNYMTNILPLHLGNLERQLGDNDYFVGNKLSVADISAYDLFRHNCLAMVPKILGKLPKLAAFVERMNNMDCF